MLSFVKKASIIAIALAGVVSAGPVEKRDNSGDATVYNTGLGACGIENSDSDYIVAVSAEYFDDFSGYSGSNPNNNPVCGRYLQANYQDSSVTVQVTDRCGGCEYGDLDFSPAAFQELTGETDGRLHGVTWELL